MEAIKAIGSERCIMSSCGGQDWMPGHVFAWTEFFQAMRERGLTVEEINLMSKVNPARLLGIEAKRDR